MKGIRSAKHPLFKSAKPFPFAWSNSANTRFVFSATCRGARAYPFAGPHAERRTDRIPEGRVVFQLSELMTAGR